MSSTEEVLVVRSISPGRLLVLLTIAGGVSLLVAAAPAVGEPPAIGAKRAEARYVLGQIRDLDSRIAKTVEAFNLASFRLERTRRALQVNTHELKVGRENVLRAQRILAQRLVQRYERDDGGSALEVVLGARSLGDLIDRIDTVNRVARQDGEIADEVRLFRARVERRQERLVQTRALQRRLVARLADQRDSIEGQLAERRQLLSSIESEISRLQAEEQARQERLRREAEARLAAQRAAAQRAAEAAAAQRATAAVTSGGGQASTEAIDVGVVASTPEGASVAPPPRYGGVVGIAMQYLGVPYRWGGASPSTGFDCSGFTAYVYAQVGVSLPHHAASQFSSGVPVSREDLQPGDLVFFDGLSHEGMYIGGGQFIHAPHTGDVVKISSLSDPWYAGSWVGARRIL
jgi:cell wall-associated NlpC family hydrolase